MSIAPEVPATALPMCEARDTSPARISTALIGMAMEWRVNDRNDACQYYYRAFQGP